MKGEDFYGAYDAQNYAIENSKALGVTPVPSLNLVYTQEEVRNVLLVTVIECYGLIVLVCYFFINVQLQCQLS